MVALPAKVQPSAQRSALEAHGSVKGDAPPLAIAVVIPLFNHANYIGEAIASVLAQSDLVDEIIVLDDGSTDDGILVAEAGLQHHPNAIVRRQSNVGAHETINRAIAATRSPYIAILNSDDAFEREKIARCRRLIQADQSIDLIFGGTSIMDSEGRPVTEGVTVDWLERSIAFLDEAEDLRLALINENFATTTSNMVFSRRLWQSLDGFQSLRYCHDLDFLLSAFGAGKVVFDRGMRHIRYRVHRSNTIKEALARIQVEIAAVLAVNLFARSQARPSPQSLRQLHMIIAEKGLAELMVVLGQLLSSGLGRVALYQAIADNPLQETLIALAPANRAKRPQPRPRRTGTLPGTGFLRRIIR